MKLLSAVLVALGLLGPGPVSAQLGPTYTGQPRLDAPQPVIAATNRLRPPGAVLRLATYNLQDFRDGEGDGAARTPEVAAAQARNAARLLDELDPDVLVLQEVENAQALRLLNGQLAEPFPLGYVTRLGDGGRKERLNLAVLSRVALDDLRELDFGPLQGRGRPTRGALGFSIDLGAGHRLLVYGVHLKSNFGDLSHNRKQRLYALQLVRKDLAQVVAARRGVYWEGVLAGDMNVDPDDPAFKSDPSLQPFADWLDLWRGRPLAERTTVPTRYGDPQLEFPPACFDRFIVAQELRRRPWTAGAPRTVPRGVDTNIFVLPGQNELHASDHYPVFLDLIR